MHRARLLPDTHIYLGILTRRWFTGTTRTAPTTIIPSTTANAASPLWPREAGKHIYVLHFFFLYIGHNAVQPTVRIVKTSSLEYTLAS